MSHLDPHVLSSRVTPAAEAAVAERARFLQRTYTWLLYGILAFCATLWAYDNVPAVENLSNSLFARPIVGLIVLFGGSFAVHALAERHPVNRVLYFAWAFLQGLVVAPLIALANAYAPNLVTQASLITAAVFLGLTAYVFVSGKDFGFLRGVLWIGFFGVLGLSLAGLLFGFDLGVWYSIAVAMLFAGFILYDTSNILHRYPSNAYVAGAIVLFTDVVILFRQILIILMSSRD